MRASLARGLFAACVVGGCLAPAVAAPDGRISPKAARLARKPVPSQPAFEPYDPDRVKAGRQPGFMDLGNGTEVRIGGRVRMDYDVRR